MGYQETGMPEEIRREIEKAEPNRESEDSRNGAKEGEPLPTMPEWLTRRWHAELRDLRERRGMAAEGKQRELSGREITKLNRLGRVEQVLQSAFSDPHDEVRAISETLQELYERQQRLTPSGDTKESLDEYRGQYREISDIIHSLRTRQREAEQRLRELEKR